MNLEQSDIDSLAALEAATKLDPSRELMEDRAAELGDFLGLSTDETLALYRAYRDRTKRAESFNGRNHAAIFASYNAAHGRTQLDPDDMGFWECGE